MDAAGPALPPRCARSGRGGASRRRRSRRGRGGSGVTPGGQGAVDVGADRVTRCARPAPATRRRLRRAMAEDRGVGLGDADSGRVDRRSSSGRPARRRPGRSPRPGAAARAVPSEFDTMASATPVACSARSPSSEARHLAAPRCPRPVKATSRVGHAAVGRCSSGGTPTSRAVGPLVAPSRSPARWRATRPGRRSPA